VEILFRKIDETLACAASSEHEARGDLSVEAAPPQISRIKASSSWARGSMMSVSWRARWCARAVADAGDLEGMVFLQQGKGRAAVGR